MSCTCSQLVAHLKLNCYSTVIADLAAAVADMALAMYVRHVVSTGSKFGDAHEAKSQGVHYCANCDLRQYI